ncbi:ubiquitin carboxyl-terminal hydrolase, family 1 [Trichophaea hybrida]|nr:ubiquitin carboxyl-terminal hydrolase, family 1 [Trichophaea hybrida]
MSATTAYRKHYLPLESNPEVFTQLIHKLGVSQDLSFEDVYSLDDPSLLSLVPRPVFALILVFPTSEVYEQQKAASEAKRETYDGSGKDEDVVWFRQTINNACGLYGILHAVCNGGAKDFIKPDSALAKIMDVCIPLAPEERAQQLEASDDLEKAHHSAATQGDSSVPANAEDDVDFHYVCFVKSHKTGHLYEMDGRCKGPIDRGMLLSRDEDLLDENSLNIIREYIQRENGGNLNFSLMALVKSWE